MIRGSTLSVINVSRDEADKVWTEATMIRVHGFHALGELSPNLLVSDPLLITNLFEGSAQSHAESA
eukprot:6242398-Prorocentrum_lima.AAC.1